MIGVWLYKQECESDVKGYLIVAIEKGRNGSPRKRLRQSNIVQYEERFAVSFQEEFPTAEQLTRHVDGIDDQFGFCLLIIEATDNFGRDCLIEEKDLLDQINIQLVTTSTPSLLLNIPANGYETDTYNSSEEGDDSDNETHSGLRSRSRSV